MIRFIWNNQISYSGPAVDAALQTHIAYIYSLKNKQAGFNLDL